MPFHSNKKIQKVAILGSTGSVGTQTVDVVRQMGFSVSLLSAWQNIDLVGTQIEQLHPEMVYVKPDVAGSLRERLGDSCPIILTDESELCAAVRETDADVVVHAIAGLAGIPTALAAADSGKRLAIANKESVIVLGDMLRERLQKSGGILIPVDSEHSAIFQCLQGEVRTENSSAICKVPDNIRRILLTASGGPFFGYSEEKLRDVTLAETLAHPTWKMGAKLTVDSATLMNKGFEIMEAVRLFGVPEDKVEVLVHRQSIIHSMVEYTDNTVIAQLSAPDMRSCIRYSLTYPERGFVPENGLNFAALASLTFASPDTRVFPLLQTAREAIRIEGCAPCGLIAADEAAVEAFFGKKIGFADIAPVVHAAMEKLPAGKMDSMENIMAFVAETKAVTWEIIKSSCGKQS